eukprot:gene9850-20488_t
MSETIFVGDIGGTNTRLLLFEVNLNDEVVSSGLLTGVVAPGGLILRREYQNQNYNNFEAVIQDFLNESGIVSSPKTACFAVAGPVKNNSVTFTNRDSWIVDGNKISSHFGISKVKLINDFVAAGYGLLTLNHEKECITLQGGVRNPSAPIACIGAGTGLGECFLTPNSNNGHYQCFPSEGGHAEFTPRNDIYEYLSVTHPDKIDSNIHHEFLSAGDLKGAVVAVNRLKNTLCEQAMDILLTAYGSEAGVAALKWIPQGGLYITGGLTSKNMDLINVPDGLFMKALLDKGRLRSVVESVPVYAVLPEDLGERGAHLVAVQDLMSLSLSSSASTSSPSLVKTAGRHTDTGDVSTSMSSSSGKTCVSCLLGWSASAVLAVAVLLLVVNKGRHLSV